MNRLRKNNMGNSKSDIPLRKIADRLVGSTKRLMRTAKTEEDLRIGFEKALAPLLKSVGIESKPKYERLSEKAKSVFRGRPDAVHGQVIIEYEKPNAFSSKRAIAHAYDQLVDYISAEIKGHKKDTGKSPTRIVGVGLDGNSIFFVQCLTGNEAKGKCALKPSFIQKGPYKFEPESAFTFITYLRALSRLPLTAEHLANQFGPKSEIAQKAVFAFVDALTNWSTSQSEVFFNEWKRLFGIVYGEQFAAGTDEKSGALAQVYGLDKQTDFQTMLFCVHTYFALIMKLISAELLSLEETGFSSSFSNTLLYATDEELKAHLTDIENGGIYSKRGITNFLEGDFFRWYLEALSSPRLGESIRDMARGLSEFEPATTTIDPEATRDLLKKLYQYLVPDVVRHHLGEYYTPDWLAELVLNEVGYKGNTLKRLLDPACGSGTFLVLAIQRAKEYARENEEPAIETVKRIIANIWGFDLNPLAVIAARTNYLFALGDLVYQLPSLEIPVYLADSVLWPERTGERLLAFGNTIEVHTSIGPFLVPKIWAEGKGFLMRKAAPILEQLVKGGYTTSEAMARFKKKGLVFPPHERVVSDFYEKVYELEKQGRNGIWARFLKNVFAPMMAERFDFVVGNPPWIRWDYLSEEYRKATLELWKNYGLFSLKGFETRLGGGKKDFSMLFTYAAADHYLSKKGKLGFLITQEVFKSKGAGEGFRKFRLGDRDLLQVIKAHDLVSVQPFEKAANKTAAIFLKKGDKTKYPVPYTVWRRKKGVGKIPTDKTLEEVKPLLQKRKLIAQPIGSKMSAWQTIAEGEESLTLIQGDNFYEAHSGAYISPYGVFWMDIEQVLSDGKLIINNLVEKGKTKIQRVKETIESELVYPALRGSDIQRWQANPKIHVLLTQNPSTREPYPEKTMKRNWPRTYGYLTRFKDILLSRASKPLQQLAEKTAFYAVFGVANYTVARYKVVWKRMTNDLVATVISQWKTAFGYKTVIPLETTALIATDNENEAHYLCAIINSKPVRNFVKSFSSAGRGFGTPSVMEYVGIPKFDSKNETHKKLSQLSKLLHKLKSEGKAEKIAELEKEVDMYVCKLFGLK